VIIDFHTFAAELRKYIKQVYVPRPTEGDFVSYSWSQNCCWI